MVPGSCAPKSLAGKPQDDEAGVLEAGVELFEGVVLRGEAALGGDVDDEQDFAAVVGERCGFAGDAVDGNVVEGRGHEGSWMFG